MQTKYNMEKIEAIWYFILLIIVIVFLLYMGISSTSKFKKAKNNCYPNQIVDYFERGDDIFSICAVDGEEYKIKKVERAN